MGQISSKCFSLEKISPATRETREWKPVLKEVTAAFKGGSVAKNRTIIYMGLTLT